MSEDAKQELFVEKIEFVKDLRVFEKGFSIDFDVPITIFVGENGSGKSTLLDLIRTEYKPSGNEALWTPQNLDGFAKISGRKPSGDQVKHFDFHSSDMKYAAVFGGDMSAQLQAQRLSSGQATTIQLGSSGMLKSKNSLLLIDEAARGYSPNMQSHFAHGLYLSTILNHNQVILSTHSEHIMRLSGMPDCKLYSVEHKQYMELNDFLKEHIKPFE